MSIQREVVSLSKRLRAQLAHITAVSAPGKNATVRFTASASLDMARSGPVCSWGPNESNSDKGLAFPAAWPASGGTPRKTWRTRSPRCARWRPRSRRPRSPPAAAPPPPAPAPRPPGTPSPKPSCTRPGACGAWCSTRRRAHSHAGSLLFCEIALTPGLCTA